MFSYHKAFQATGTYSISARTLTKHGSGSPISANSGFVMGCQHSPPGLDPLHQPATHVGGIAVCWPYLWRNSMGVLPRLFAPVPAGPLTFTAPLHEGHSDPTGRLGGTFSGLHLYPWPRNWDLVMVPDPIFSSSPYQMGEDHPCWGLASQLTHRAKCGYISLVRAIIHVFGGDP